MTREPRFGINLIEQGDPSAVREHVRWADDHGIDVVVVPDHRGVAAPIPLMLAIAQRVADRRRTRPPRVVTERVATR